MAELTKDQFKDLLMNAVRQHGMSYRHSFAVHVRWECDNTAAKRDFENFQTFLKVFALSPAQELVIKDDDVIPGWTVLDTVKKTILAAKAASTSGRSLIIFHYAGHGIPGPDGTLQLCTTPTMGRHSRYFNDRAFFSEIDRSSFLLRDDSEVDVVLLFDCCYSFLATRAVNSSGRVVEVLAAVDAKSKTANIPGQRVSFTGKLATKVAWLRGRGKDHIDLAELVALLRVEDSPAKRPSHTLRVGLSSVRLRFPASTTSTPTASAPTASAPTTAVPLRGPGLRAVFHLTVNKSFSSDQLKCFLKWLGALNPEVGLRLEGVYETSSMCVILSGSYPVFLKLQNAPSVTLICETQESNKLDDIIPRSVASTGNSAPPE